MQQRSPSPVPGIKVADEVWVATALLHREHPERADFSISEIEERARREGIGGPVLRPGVRVHATQHCVASRSPNPGRYCMLAETDGNRRRLFRPGDPVHPERRGAKTKPRREELPERYRELLDWYEREYASEASALEVPTRGGRPGVVDALLQLRGCAVRLFRDEAPDAYVERLRQGWS